MTPDEAIAALGGTQERAARALGLTQSAIGQWVARGAVPIPRQYQIEVLTEGVVRAERPAGTDESAAAA